MKEKCRNCGTRMDNITWQCSECGAWPEHGHFIWVVPPSSETYEYSDKDASEFVAHECAICGLRAEGEFETVDTVMENAPCDSGGVA